MAAFITNMPSTGAVLSAYTSFAASAMMARTMISETQSIIFKLLPQKLTSIITTKLDVMFGKISSKMVILIDEKQGLTHNDLYKAAGTYLATKISPTQNNLKAFKLEASKNLTFKTSSGEEIMDVFEGIEISWKFQCTQKQTTTMSIGSGPPSHGYETTSEMRYYRISFHKKNREIVMNSYLPYVVKRAKEIDHGNKVVKLFALNGMNGMMGCGGREPDSITLRNSCKFENLAMDPEEKRVLMDDLERFVKRREFYKRIGKAWKRGYLLYGPPGTGKSSLVAAMADYLKFNVYDLELTTVHNNSMLRSMLLSTANKSIIVIEDIDCSANLQDRIGRTGIMYPNDQHINRLTLSGVLNAIDGLWSSSGDAKIIVFTTNHKDKLDPALLRPGRMDVHVHMTYLTPSGFETLASNYLHIDDHPRFVEIERLITEVEVTPAEIAEELMKSDDADVALESVVELVNGKKRKKMEKESNSEEQNDPKEKNEIKKRKKNFELEKESSGQSDADYALNYMNSGAFPGMDFHDLDLNYKV